jgi:leucyl-tRNA synthetase
VNLSTWFKSHVAGRSTLRGEGKGGVDTGLKVVNPFNGDIVPLYVGNLRADGIRHRAIMAVPAHDTRDFAFAKKYGIPIKVVIDRPGDPLSAAAMDDRLCR